MNFIQRKKLLLNWAAMPLLRVALCLIIGILISQFNILNFRHLSFIITGLILLLFILESKKSIRIWVSRILSLAIHLIFIFFGISISTINNTDLDPHHYKHQIKGYHEIIGHLKEDLKNKKSTSVTVHVKKIDGIDVRGKLLVYFKKDSLFNKPDYQPGDVIMLKGYPNEIKAPTNPKAFDFSRFMNYKKVHYQMFVSVKNHQKIDHQPLLWPVRIAYRLRSYAMTLFEKKIKDQEVLAISSAMVLGKREFIDKDLQKAFADTGAVHILAVSGLHVGIIVYLFRLFFNLFKSRSNTFKWLRYIVMLIVVIGYTIITGASPAVVRAALMFLTLEAGRLWFRYSNIYNILAFSAICILIYDPYYLFQLGFLLSYLALIGIVFLQPKLMRWLPEKLVYKNRVSTKFFELATVSIAAQFLIFPISLFIFHKFPLSFIISGVIAVFVAPFLLGAGLLFVAFSKISLVGDFIGSVFIWMGTYFVKCIYWIQDLPLKPLENIWISSSTMISMYMILITIMFLVGYKRNKIVERFHRPDFTVQKRGVMIIFFCVCIILSNSAWFTYRTKSNAEIVIYDVSNETLIDIFEGENLYTIMSKDIDPEKIKYASNQYRIYQNYPKMHTVDLRNIAADHSVRSFLFLNNYLIYNDKKIALGHLMQKPFQIRSSDILLLSHKSQLLPYQIMKKHTTDLVVLDSSISYKLTNYWKSYCKKHDIPIYIIREKGAFILK